MKNALINPKEKIFNPNTGEELGARVCDVEASRFEVHPSLLWVDCEDNINTTDWYYDLNTNEFKQIPEYVPPPAPDQPETTGTEPL